LDDNIIEHPQVKNGETDSSVPSPFKQIHSGFVGIVGRPNVGKSTLINYLTGNKVAITAPKPQTTRENIIGVHHGEDLQIVFVDTPGYHVAKKRLNKYMVKSAVTAISDVDLVLILVDATARKDEFKTRHGALDLVKRANQLGKPIIIALNKVDSTKPKSILLPMLEKWNDVEGIKSVIPISARTGDGVDILLEEIKPFLTLGPAYYPDDMITDRPNEWIASELIRENMIMLLSQELPYAIAVVVERFKQKDAGLFIEAFIYVERSSQKAIILGKRGTMIKEIGELSRNSLSIHFKENVHLFLQVRVKPDWTDRSGSIKEMGYE
jgi:GTPase